jgi:hypothetical protein
MDALPVGAESQILERKSMLAELHGVPKGALQTVFGRALGRRIWLEGRRSSPPAQAARTEEADAGQHPTPFGPTDTEIVHGMIGYLSRRAGEELRQERRQAKTVGLRLVYGGGARMHRLRLAKPTSDEQEIAAATLELFRRAGLPSGVALESVDLTATSIEAESVRDEAAALDCLLGGSRAWT